ncbi:glycosyltransferase [Oerskovia turbata]|uniref:glycosyltransferase n=1 Tax=Oerskovia turbata TaxID=1713 RepID=UPI0004C08FF8|nr:glycosyltransferase [Oerskovia turbata]
MSSGPLPDRSSVKVVAVVVAFNRRDLLKDALDALDAQTHPLAGVVVVDNRSDDDSAVVAAEHPIGATVLELSRNTGGAGGFAAGIAHALSEFDPECLWLMDDDTIPTPSALDELLRAREEYPEPVALLGSRVVWHDGRDHPMNTPRRRPGATRDEISDSSAVGAVPVRSSSFVSMLIDTRAVRYHGLPIADYFIWNDDFEYSCRILRRGIGLYVPASVVEHRTQKFGATDTDPGDRFYFEVRNKIWMLTRSTSLSPEERVLYAGSSLRRWTRTFAGSSQRAVLRRAAIKGIRDGMLRGPRSTVKVLDGSGISTDEVLDAEAGSPRRRGE